MNDFFETAEYIKSNMNGFSPEIAIILGSGLGTLADEIEDKKKIEYKDIPGFPVSTVVGHAGELIWGRISGKSVLAMNGRFHFYEGYDITKTTFPIRIFSLLGIKTLILTNAAGGINLGFNPGDLMIITDHINFSGISPLRGPNLSEFGTRFPDMSNLYDLNLIKTIKETGTSQNIPLQEGVYAYMQGPNYETPAEIKALRTLGADAVGMSTVPEAIVARHCGIKVVAISCITNMAAGILDKPLSHEEVSETAGKVKENFKRLIKNFVANI